MANHGTTAFWGMVINNYDETDLALVQQGYPDFVRQIVYTLEKGEETKTPHIQAYVRLHRQQRMSYMRKLFPGASDFKALNSDEYKLNAQRYAQKLDSTAESPAVITNNPFPDPVVELVSVIEDALKHYAPTNDVRDWRMLRSKEILPWICMVEQQRVAVQPRLAKFYVGATYKNVKKEYLSALVVHVISLVDTHTHTHKDEKFSHQGGITSDASEASQDQGSQVGAGEGSGGSEDDEDYEDSEGSESEAGSESDDSGRSESDAESED